MSLAEILDKGVANPNPWANFRVNNVYADGDVEIGGNIVLGNNSSIDFPNNNSLSTYEKQTFAGNTWSGPGANPIAGIICVTKLGPIIVLKFAGFVQASANGGGQIATASTTLLANMRPSAPIYASAIGQNNGNSTLVTIRIGDDGQILMGNGIDVPLANFTQNTSNWGLEHSTITYLSDDGF